MCTMSSEVDLFLQLLVRQLEKFEVKQGETVFVLYVDKIDWLESGH